ncbi:MAG: hypothetical protein N3F06_03835, partial [Nitrososphaerales archaeon]|nr:hypothetical protein [Nitrososphaerales archaeon]
MSFKILNLQELEFSLPTLDEQSFREVLQFSEFLGYDNVNKKGLYKLNLEKCATLDVDDLRRLARYGIDLSKDVLREIESLREKRLVNISIYGGDLIIRATPSAAPLIPSLCIYEQKLSL